MAVNTYSTPNNKPANAGDIIIRTQQVDSNGALLAGASAQTATNTTAVAAGTATNTVIKNAPGRLFQVLVTTTGTAAQNIYDNATTNAGTVIAAVPANAAVGSVFTFNAPAANGITVGGIAASPGITVSWA